MFLHSSSMLFDSSVMLCLLEVRRASFWVIECFEVRRSFTMLIFKCVSFSNSKLFGAFLFLFWQTWGAFW